MAGGRITDFFQLKRPPPLSATDESYNSSSLEVVQNSQHPFFLAQVKRRKELQFAQEKDSSRTLRSSWSDEAPMFPSIPHIAQCVKEEPEFAQERDSPHTLRCNRSVGASLFSPINHHPDSFYTFNFDHQLLPSFDPNKVQASFDSGLFEETMKKIANWIDDCSITDQSDHDDLWTAIDFHEMKRPIIFIYGPSGVGKSSIAKKMAERLSIPLREIDNSGSQRNWKPFEDILSTSHGQRDTLRRFLKPTQSSVTVEQHGPPPVVAHDLKMVVLIDQVDLVFPSDKFYTPLSAFLKAVTDSVLVILTANSSPNLLTKFFDLPVGSMQIEMKAKVPPTHVEEKDFDTLMRDSDWEFIKSHTMYSLQCIDDEGSNPIPAIPFDLLIHEKWIHSSLDLFIDWEPPDLPERDQLLVNLHCEGFMLGCRAHSDWVMYYKPAWRRLEMNAVEAQQLRIRRTNRPIKPRPYLTGIPQKFIDRLLQL